MSEAVHTRWRWLPPDASTPVDALRLLRRGIDHGRLVEAGRREAAEPVASWKSAAPILLPRQLDSFDELSRQRIMRTQWMFDKLRGGADFSELFWARIDDSSGVEAAGSTIDTSDEREIEKLHASFGGEDSDLYAKLSWISTDEDDHSLRIRFSFGSELLDDWSTDPQQSQAADRFSEIAFPEMSLLAHDRVVQRMLARLCACPVRLSERILYSNAPGGGARFHHDAETEQLGVAYAQLAGRTAWLALPAVRLAETLSHLDLPGHWSETLADEGAAALGGELSEIEAWLNDDAELTRRLVEAGWLFVLEPRDVLLLPSHNAEHTAWHSVFALGEEASLSLSFGIFSK